MGNSSCPRFAALPLILGEEDLLDRMNNYMGNYIKYIHGSSFLL